MAQFGLTEDELRSMTIIIIRSDLSQCNSAEWIFLRAGKPTEYLFRRTLEYLDVDNYGPFREVQMAGCGIKCGYA